MLVRLFPPQQSSEKGSNSKWVTSAINHRISLKLENSLKSHEKGTTGRAKSAVLDETQEGTIIIINRNKSIRAKHQARNEGVTVSLDAPEDLQWQTEQKIDEQILDGKELTWTISRFSVKLSKHRQDITGKINPTSRDHLMKEKFLRQLHMDGNPKGTWQLQGHKLVGVHEQMEEEENPYQES
ncbi:hypothetical protein WISP_55164 [Willisornis vidua]|uniref:Uncharacterized protein n=1 Tax=Willisornis vidua TaxID=1566151 RepID=A0ABQ9DIG5_9PASS|nr:hypothetical protein WISP_55164 [Willisornis vidua]